MADTPTKQPTKKALEQVISNNDPDGLIGFEETAFFEVREKAYNLSAQDKVQLEKAKQTLAIDISSLANSGGGYIFIGLKTEVLTTRPAEYVAKVTGIKDENINAEQMSRVLREHTVPRMTMQTLKHGFIGKDKTVFWVEVPNAKATGEYPVLVKKAKWDVESETFLHGEMYALYHRDGAENLLETPEKVQQILAGAANSNVNREQITTAQFQRLSEQLQDLLANQKTPENKTNDDGIKSFLDNANEKLVDDGGYFYIYAKPKTPITSENFFDDELNSKSPYNYIKNPPTLRNFGWDLNVATSEWPYPNGNSWEITNGTRKLLQLTNEGEVFGAISIDRSLDWGTNQYMPTDGSVDALVNEVALSEYIYNFMVFINEYRKGRIGNFDYELRYGFRNVEGKKISLLQSDRIVFVSYKVAGQLIKMPVWQDEYLMGITPERKAGTVILNVIKGGFGIPQNPTPIAKDEHGNVQVDTEFYKNLH